MTKMREAFYAIKPDGTEAEYVLFFAGYQAAIAAVKEGGPACYMGTYNEHDIRDMRTVVMRHKESFEPTPDRVVPLYHIPGDET